MGSGSGANTCSSPSRGRTGCSSRRRRKYGKVKRKAGEPEEIQVGEELSACPRCGYGAGFHVAFRRQGRALRLLRPGALSCDPIWGAVSGFRILGGGSLASSLDLRCTRKSALDLSPGKLRSDPPSFRRSAACAPCGGAPGAPPPPPL